MYINVQWCSEHHPLALCCEGERKWRLIWMERRSGLERSLVFLPGLCSLYWFLGRWVDYSWLRNLGLMDVGDRWN